MSDVLKRSRPGHPRRKYRARFKPFLIANRRGLAGLLVGYLLGIVIFNLTMDGYLQGFMHGFWTTALLALVLLGFLTATGSMNQVTGSWGEDNTRDILKWAMRRRLIYGWVDNVEVQGGDVDHLVATSNGWIAIDSKWHSSGLDATVIERDATRALQAARRARLVLRSLKSADDVRPVAVVWGGNQSDIPEGTQTAHGVDFISGSHLKRWLRNQPRGGGDAQLARTQLRQLAQFRQRVRPPDPPH